MELDHGVLLHLSFFKADSGFARSGAITMRGEHVSLLCLSEVCQDNPIGKSTE